MEGAHYTRQYEDPANGHGKPDEGWQEHQGV
jgi:hypothetical protein